MGLSHKESLLLIILDDLRRANLRVLRVKPDIAKGTSLAQEIPALIQFDLDLREPLAIGVREIPLVVQSVFLCDKALNIIEDRLIPDLILHERLLSRGYDRKGHDFMLRPTHTGVNRTSLRHDAVNSSAGTRAIKTVFLQDHTRRTKRTPDDGSARIWECTLLNIVGHGGSCHRASCRACDCSI